MSVSNVNPGNFFGGTWEAWGSGRVPVGVDASDDNFNTVEKIGGVASVSLAHEHTVDSHNHSTGDHILTVNEIPSHGHSFSGNTGNAGSHGHSFSGTTSANGTHNHTYREFYQVQSHAPSAAQCVAANSDTDANPGAHTKDAGNHNHTFSGTTGSAGNHGHSFSGTTGSSGGGRAHSHGNTGSAAPGTSSQLGNTSVLQPYITCYMWKRTA